MPCPACIVALMGTDTPEPAGMTTGAKLALAGAGLLAAWLIFFPWTPGSLKRNPRRREYVVTWWKRGRRMQFKHVFSKKAADKLVRDKERMGFTATSEAYG